MVTCAGLSACGDISLPIPNILGNRGESETTVTRDMVTLAGMHGFCVDPQSTRSSSASAFVVFGNCRAITGTQTAPQPRINAVVTSTVRLGDPTVPRIADSSGQLTDFFKSDVGRILLSRENDPSSIKVLESGPARDGSYYLYVNDTGNGAPEGTEDTYWRAYLDVRNSVVTISVLSLETTPLSRNEGLEIMRGFTSKIHASQTQTLEQNAEVQEVEQAPTPTSSGNKPIQRPETEVPGASKTTRKGLLGRLFG